MDTEEPAGQEATAAVQADAVGDSCPGYGAAAHGDRDTGPASPVRLAFASFLMLFVELALIRWVGANNVFVNNATNFVLLASFLGIGIGFLNARSERDYVRWTPVALLALVAFVLAFPVVVATLNGPNPYHGRGSMNALPQPLSLTIVFVLVVPVMAGQISIPAREGMTRGAMGRESGVVSATRRLVTRRWTWTGGGYRSAWPPGWRCRLR